jgi:hypothetical protein
VLAESEMASAPRTIVRVLATLDDGNSIRLVIWLLATLFVVVFGIAVNADVDNPYDSCEVVIAVQHF